jgi:serine/threonine-protein kinase
VTDSLIAVRRIETDIETYLAQVGEVFRAFRQQDSGNVAYGVLAPEGTPPPDGTRSPDGTPSAGRRWFVKHAADPRAILSLRRAQALNTRVRHPALPRFYNAFETPGGLALVYEWVPGELLYYPGRTPPDRRRDPAFAPVRFRALPVEKILDALDTIYDLHLLLADHGYIAVDFYDGCIMYDFEGARTYVCDLDEYQLGPFALDMDRGFGSHRFMAPEEFQRGARIDQVTNVFTLGRTAMLLLGDGTVSFDGWAGTEAMKAVVQRATDPDRAVRYPSVRAFVDAWHSAVGS